MEALYNEAHSAAKQAGFDYDQFHALVHGGEYGQAKGGAKGKTLTKADVKRILKDAKKTREEIEQLLYVLESGHGAPADSVHGLVDELEAAYSSLGLGFGAPTSIMPTHSGRAATPPRPSTPEQVLRSSSSTITAKDDPLYEVVKSHGTRPIPVGDLALMNHAIGMAPTVDVAQFSIATNTGLRFIIRTRTLRDQEKPVDVLTTRAVTDRYMPVWDALSSDSANMPYPGMREQMIRFQQEDPKKLLEPVTLGDLKASLLSMKEGTVVATGMNDAYSAYMEQMRRMRDNYRPVEPLRHVVVGLSELENVTDSKTITETGCDIGNVDAIKPVFTEGGRIGRTKIKDSTTIMEIAKAMCKNPNRAMSPECTIHLDYEDISGKRFQRRLHNFNTSPMCKMIKEGTFRPFNEGLNSSSASISLTYVNLIDMINKTSLKSVLMVVPNNKTLKNLSERIVDEFGGAAAGVEVQYRTGTKTFSKDRIHDAVSRVHVPTGSALDIIVKHPTGDTDEMTHTVADTAGLIPALKELIIADGASGIDDVYNVELTLGAFQYGVTKFSPMKENVRLIVASNIKANDFARILTQRLGPYAAPGSTGAKIEYLIMRTPSKHSDRNVINIESADNLLSTLQSLTSNSTRSFKLVAVVSGVDKNRLHGRVRVSESERELIGLPVPKTRTLKQFITEIYHFVPSMLWSAEARKELNKLRVIIPKTRDEAVKMWNNYSNAMQKIKIQYHMGMQRMPTFEPAEYNREKVERILYIQQGVLTPVIPIRALLPLDYKVTEMEKVIQDSYDFFQKRLRTYYTLYDMMQGRPVKQDSVYQEAYVVNKAPTDELESNAHTYVQAKSDSATVLENGDDTRLPSLKDAYRVTMVILPSDEVLTDYKTKALYSEADVKEIRRSYLKTIRFE